MSKLSISLFLLVLVAIIFVNFSIAPVKIGPEVAVAKEDCGPNSNTPCACGYVACVEAGGEPEGNCWDGYCACMGGECD